MKQFLPPHLPQRHIHRLTWRMRYPVYITAPTREDAIRMALLHKPADIPPGTELFYGPVAGEPVGKAS